MSVLVIIYGPDLISYETTRSTIHPTQKSALLSSTLFCFFPLILFLVETLNQLTEKNKKLFLSSPFLSLGETTGIARRREEYRRNYYNYRRSHRLFVGNNASWEERKFEKKKKKLETPIHFFFGGYFNWFVWIKYSAMDVIG